MYGKLKGYELFNQCLKLTFEKGVKFLLVINPGVVEVHSSFMPQAISIEKRCQVLLKRERDCLIVKTAQLEIAIYNNFLLDVYCVTTQQLLEKNAKTTQIIHPNYHVAPTMSNYSMTMRECVYERL